LLELDELAMKRDRRLELDEPAVALVLCREEGMVADGDELHPRG
jgi:hypothetical protein